MTDDTTPIEKTLRGLCCECHHVWIVAHLHLPMPAYAVAKLLKRAACPVCAGTKVYVATGDNPERTRP